MKKKHAKLCSLLTIVGTSLIGFSLMGALITSIGSNKVTTTSQLTQSATTRASVVPKPLSEAGVKIVSPSLSSGAVSIEDVKDVDGNYFLPATGLSDNSNAKVVKVNFQMQYLYDWTCKDANYQTRQIVADTDNLGYYYALLVNETNCAIADAGDGNDDQNHHKFANVTSPAIVVQLYDDGSSLTEKQRYNLQLPDFSINDYNSLGNHLATGSQPKPSDSNSGYATDNIWNHVYVQDAIKPEDTNDKLSFIRSATGGGTQIVGGDAIDGTPSSSSGTSKGSPTYVNDAKKSIIYKLLDKNSPQTNGTNSNSSTNGDYYILKKLYLNNANNMVYIKDPVSNKKMILIFGGNAYQNFWFYDFVINMESPKNQHDVKPLLYANYNFDPTHATTINETMYDKVQKQYYYLPFMKKNKVSNLAWYVGGAKTIKLSSRTGNQSNSYIFLGMMQPNVSDFNAQLYALNKSNIAATSNSIDDIKKGTYGTTEQVNYFNSSDCGQTNFAQNNYDQNKAMNSDLQFVKSSSGSWNTEKYQNTEVLVGSSSINASYQLLSPAGYTNSIPRDISNFWYPFSAIQSLTILPFMSSSIASLIATDLDSGKEQSIYLNDFFDVNSSSRNKTFSLFNCVYNENQFYNFDFGKKFVPINSTWIQDIQGPVSPNTISDPAHSTGFLNQGFIRVGQDDYGFSRILTNINPKPTSKYTNVLNDGWNNVASQKIVAFSPQLTSEVVNTTFGEYNRVAATLVVRGFIYTVTYNFEILPKFGIVPIANLNNSVVSNIPSNHINDLSNLLSLSYNNNDWLLSYQNKDNKHILYTLKYTLDNTWDFYSNEVSNSSTSEHLNKVILSGYDNCLTISDKQINFLNMSNPNNVISSIFNGGSIADNTNIWGTISQVDSQYLVDTGLIKETANKIVHTSSLLNQLVQYSGGWSVDPLTNKPTELPKIINPRTEGSTVVFDIALKYSDGVYYTSAPFDSTEYPDVVQCVELATPTFRYEGFNPLEPWVLPVIISSSIVVFVMILSLGIVIPVRMRKNRILTQKGFSSTTEKIDKLTDAVSNTYKKISEAQMNSSKRPQLLKSSEMNRQENYNRKNLEPGKPTTPPSGPSMPPKKPN
ncbi:hypothetical protein [Mycoplasmoides alvi]|uniref:hypothetical protein n=1 Tax=Mycoplasmoides alvi TaxID=78580 RepID=UPI00051C1B17|nr:hypothetical protein [Mycoplasmoides alvi]